MAGIYKVYITDKWIYAKSERCRAVYVKLAALQDAMPCSLVKVCGFKEHANPN
jgi:hypothetical protein